MDSKTSSKMSWILDNTVLEQLKCFTCKNYISVGPVKQTSDGYNCGRCSTNGNDVTTLCEMFAKNGLFPCRFDVNGCTEKVAFGEKMVNHEKECEYRLTSCPIDSCEWNGVATTTFEHCLNDHKECIVLENNDFELNVNLRESVNKKSIMKRQNGEVLLLYLLYSEEMGLSINVKFFILKNKKRTLRYNLVIESSDKVNSMKLENRQLTPYCAKLSLEMIPLNILCCLDKTTVSITIKFERVQNADISECDSCDQALPLYMLKCARNHRFCNKCRNIEQKCIFCNDCLSIQNNYKLMKSEGGNFGCFNAVYGCHFLSNSARLEEHAEECVPMKCLVKNCQWKGVECALLNHLRTHKTTANSTISITAENIEDNTYFVPHYTGFCKHKIRHSLSEAYGLFILQVVVDDIKNTIKLVVNYNSILSFNAVFTGGSFQVTAGKNYLYKSAIYTMTCCF